MRSRGKHKARVFQIVEFVDDLTGAVHASADLTDASRLMALRFRREAA